MLLVIEYVSYVIRFWEENTDAKYNEVSEKTYQSMPSKQLL